MKVWREAGEARRRQKQYPQLTDAELERVKLRIGELLQLEM